MTGDDMHDKDAKSRIFAGAERHAPLFFVLFAVAGLGAFGAAMRRETYRPLVMADRPGAAALRADLGPSPPRLAVRPPPSFVKGIYVSASTAGYKKRFDQLVDLVDRTELNAMVIDVKGDYGDLAFVPEDESLKAY